ncbi:hypothetical protein niasHS_000750 [Heterodera schachtii]|uniref:Uncharacterized protein n=1 Tax=Heterodera schachtii TaxID=97005 RepID=A0ABD2KKT8_HETSC
MVINSQINKHIMSDQKQLFLFGQTLPGNESGLLERMKKCADKRNKIKRAAESEQIAVGSTHPSLFCSRPTSGICNG